MEFPLGVQGAPSTPRGTAVSCRRVIRGLLACLGAAAAQASAADNRGTATQAAQLPAITVTAGQEEDHGPVRATSPRSRASAPRRARRSWKRRSPCPWSRASRSRCSSRPAPARRCATCRRQQRALWRLRRAAGHHAHTRHRRRLLPGWPARHQQCVDVDAADRPYTLERIEVLRGPSSFLYGQGTGGGVVNQVSRRPQREASHEVFVQAGSFRQRQIGFDSTGRSMTMARCYTG